MSYSIYDKELHLCLIINMFPFSFMSQTATKLHIDNRGSKLDIHEKYTYVNSIEGDPVGYMRGQSWGRQVCL